MSLRAHAGARRGARAALASAAAAVLLLSGCGDTDVAAKFDGHVVTEDEVSAAVKEINEAFKPQQPFTGQQALTALIRAPYLLDYAAEHGFPQTESMARATIPLHDPSPSTVRILQSMAVIDHLQQPDNVALSKALSELEVDVNPKYGAYVAEQAAVGPNVPEWLEFSVDDADK